MPQPRLTRRLTTAFLLGAAALLAGTANSAPARTTATHAAPGAPRAEAAEGTDGCRAIGGARWDRTELFFGLSRPGGVVTEAEFQAFLDTQVTPRFPDGLTLLSGLGQFRNAAGVPIQEGSKLLILLYPRRDAEAGPKIEQIRAEYKRQFNQESVLRVDAMGCVSF
jgi:hypothetical protein